MARSRLIFVEGIMGSGKSTTARWLARLYRRSGIPAQPVPEARPHPTNVFRSLPHWKQPWLDLRAEELMTHSYANWQAFVRRALADSHIFVFDGQLFHGDFTCLLLMACAPELLYQYVYNVLQLAQPLHPMIIYFYQSDVAQALDRIGAQRGQGWIKSQVAWKVASPYGRQRGLVGIDGWKQLYRDYRELTDMCMQTLTSLSLRSKPARVSGPAIRLESVNLWISPSFLSLPGSAGSISSTIILSIFGRPLRPIGTSPYHKEIVCSVAFGGGWEGSSPSQLRQ